MLLVAGGFVQASFLCILAFSHHPHGQPKPPVFQRGVDRLTAVSPFFVLRQEVQEGVEPRVEGRQGPGDLVAHGDHGHGVTGDSLRDLQQEEDGSGHMEGEETQSEEESDGDDGLDGFPSAIGVRGVGAEEYRHPFVPPQHPRLSFVPSSSEFDHSGTAPLPSVHARVSRLSRTSPGRRLRMQSPKYGENDVRVAPGDDGEGKKEAEQMENDAIGNVIGELLVYGVVPAVLVLLNHPPPAVLARIHVCG